MIETFTSSTSSALERGREFGARFESRIRENIEIYRRLFLLSGKRSLEEVRAYAEQLLPVVRQYSPSIADEIQGMAEGARVPQSDVMALNARTELLAACAGPATSECSVVIYLWAAGREVSPLAVQTWDWHSELRDGWLVWTIEDGNHMVRVLTEYGVVGKIGVSTMGVGVLLNMLHHEQDGQLPLGLPVHVAARSILDERVNLGAATARIGSASFSASSSLSLVLREGVHATAFSLELFPGGPAYCLPNDRGILVHTNHFLSASGASGDRAPKSGLSSFSRYEQLRRGLHGMAEPDVEPILQLMSSHVGGTHAICRHAMPDAPFGESAETLAVVQLDVGSCSLRVGRGGPCTVSRWVALGSAWPADTSTTVSVE